MPQVNGDKPISLEKHAALSKDLRDEVNAASVERSWDKVVKAVTKAKGQGLALSGRWVGLLFGISGFCTKQGWAGSSIFRLL